MENEAATGLWPSYDTWLIRQIEALQETGWLGWLIGQFLEAPYNIFFALTHPGMWLDFSDKQAITRLVYFGGSKELLFAFFFVVLTVLIIGFLRREVMWGTVRTLEGVSNWIGRLAAWAGFAMVLQQILIIFMQRVFAVSQIGFGFGIPIIKDVSWWSEMLKLENALVVSLCVAYAFVQGAHVRVDLVYAPISFRAKKVVDMVGAVLFMLPAALLIWMYSWFFLWRHLIVPKPSASDALDRLMMKSRALRWNVETFGFSPNGFDAYFLFKILLVLFTGLVLVQAVTFFMRSWLEFREGEESHNKYLDHDTLDATEVAMAQAGHGQ